MFLKGILKKVLKKSIALKESQKDFFNAQKIYAESVDRIPGENLLQIYIYLKSYKLLKKKFEKKT